MMLEKLSKLPIEELRSMAAVRGVRHRKNARADTIAALILQAETAQPAPQPKKEDEMKHPAARVVEQPVPHTKEAVLEAIAKFAAKDGFEAMFPGDGTWHFKCKGAEECGNLAIPMRVIVMKADSVSRGRRAPMSLGTSFVNGTYGDTILMV